MLAEAEGLGMQITIQPFTVHKRVPLTISRGTSGESTNVWVRIQSEGIEGWGEASPFSVGDHQQLTPDILAELQYVVGLLEPYTPFDYQQIEQILKREGLSSAPRAALDVALQDWWGQRLGLPLWRLWGLDRQRIQPTSVTVGLNTPEGAQQRLRLWQQLVEVRSLKIKLGHPDGLEADQAMIHALLPLVTGATKISVDANGGWSLSDALKMSHWLAEYRVTYIEQPLPRGQEQDLPALYARSPLPIFADESCFTSHDIPALADRVHGINIKLMKSGGLTEAKRMIATARACGLQVMFGCYSDSVLANTALAHLSPLADHLDLDSHLNLIDDPFQGAVMEHACLMPTTRPGLGVLHHASQS